MPADFAKTGLWVRRPDDRVPARFQVLGERSSGTNLLTRLLIRNSALEPAEALGWKHGFPRALAIPADLAVICAVRDAADWALSMHAKPWHTVPAMQALEFSDFIRARWDTVIDRPRYFGGTAAQAIAGQPLQQDRDPASGAAFADLFALRRAKLTGLLSYPERGCICAVLRIEEVQAAPEAMIGRLLTALGHSAPEARFRPVIRRLGAKFKPAVAHRPATPARMPAADRAFMIARLDPRTEARLGYRY